MAKKVAISVCDNGDEEATAITYWKEQGYKLAMDDVREVNRVTVFEENGGQQQQWTKRYDGGRGVRVLVFLSE